MVNFENLNWVYLESTKIYRIAYCNNNLYVEFIEKHDGKMSLFNESYNKAIIYIYKEVPQEIFESILNKKCISYSQNKPSHGATLYQLIEKNNNYTFEKSFW